MKVGSLVECINDNWQPRDYGVIYATKNTIYTVRDIIIRDNRTGIRLEEIRNKPNPITEPAFHIVCFRELQPPMEIKIEKLISEPLEV